ncbi:MAG: hypothetical protein ACKVTZ_08245, partial [Bacteroidia bacterium]
MRKSYSLRSTIAGFLSPPKWRTSLILVCSLLHFWSLSAQTTTVIGTGTLLSSTYGPTRLTSATPLRYSRYWYIYNATEMTTAGIPSGSTITKVEWFKNGTGVVTANTGTLNVYMNNTSLSNAGMVTPSPWTTAIAGATLVSTKFFDNGANNFPASGWVEFPVSSFTYSGGTLEIVTDWDGGSPAMALTAAITWQHSNGLTANSALGGSNGTTAPASLTNSFGGVNRPNIRITYNPPAGCSGIPTAGTASAPATACSGANFTANLAGSTTGSGITLQWESAPDVAGAPGTWAAIGGATS